MRITLQHVSKGKEIALPLVSCEFRSGEATRVVMETEQRPTVLGLIASGRMRPATGRVLLNGTAGRRRDIRHRVALVDAPHVSDPEPNVSLGGAIAEELMFAGRSSDPVSARMWARSIGIHEHLGIPMGDVAPEVRIRVLMELAALREGVEALVLVSPDRHGGDPRHWWRIAELMAKRGFAVLVIAGAAADLALNPEAPERIAAQEAGE